MHTRRVRALIVTLGGAMGICAILGRRSRLAAVALGLLSAVWVLVDKDFEGRTLVVVAPGRGLVAADLVGISTATIGGWQWLRLLRSARHGDPALTPRH